jgi:hypothetical protein
MSIFQDGSYEMVPKMYILSLRMEGISYLQDEWKSHCHKEENMNPNHLDCSIENCHKLNKEFSCVWDTWKWLSLGIHIKLMLRQFQFVTSLAYQIFSFPN